MKNNCGKCQYYYEGGTFCGWADQCCTIHQETKSNCQDFKQIKNLDEAKKPIAIGDEVYLAGNRVLTKYVVIRITNNDAAIMDKGGQVDSMISLKNLLRTGRHFYQLESLFADMDW